MTGRFHCGTSSWSSKDWLGPFYPKGTRPGDFLAEYAKHFGAVETDATYYRVPSREMVRIWHDRLPDGFLMSAKFPRSICHAGEKALPDPTRILDLEGTARDRLDYLRAMSELKDKCGPLVLQFPYFNRQVFPSARPFLERLDRYLTALPPDFRYAVEIRNKAWLTREFHEILCRNNVAMVLVDQAWMPHGDELPRRLDPLTTDFAYIRLLGDRKKIEAITKTWEKEVLDMGDRLARWVTLIHTLRDQVPETFAFVNNHYAGHAPTTVRRLLEQL